MNMSLNSLQNVILCTYCFDVTKKFIQKTANYGSSAGHLMQECNYTAPEPERYIEFLVILFWFYLDHVTPLIRFC